MLSIRHQYIKENPCPQTTANSVRPSYVLDIVLWWGYGQDSEEYRKWAPGKISTTWRYDPWFALEKL